MDVQNVSWRGAVFAGPLALLLALSSAGCAAATPAGPEASPPPAPSAAGPSQDPSPSVPPTTPDAGWNGSGDSFGVDHVRWPGTVSGARSVLKSMPQREGGAGRKLYYNSGAGEDPPAAEAGVIYGKLGSVQVYQEYVSKDTASGKPELMSANSLLSASFGLIFACAKGTYRGTAPRPTYPGGGPGVTGKRLTKSVWFSCAIDGAEGDEGFTGQAVGWTSMKTAWLVVGGDEKIVRALVSDLHDAAT